MTDKELNDAALQKLLQQFVRSDFFNALEVHLLRESDKASQGTETSVAVAHGKRLGISYVFEQIESLATPLVNEKPKKQSTDPDLES